MKSTRRHVLQAGLFGGLGSLFSPGTTAGQTAPAKTVAKRPRGIIFMVSDGMSPGVLTMAEAFSQQVRKRGTAWCELLRSPGSVQGLMDTASADSLVTDSAAAASAWGGGKRIPNGQVNVDANGKQIEPIGVKLRAKGVRFGLVTTATVTHATPAGFAAVSTSRGDEYGIAPQYLDRADIVLGGGAPFFNPASRPDKRDLAGDFAKAGYGVVHTRDELLAAKSPRLLGTFSDGHIPFTIDRDHDEALARTVPTLAEMTTAALDRLLSGAAPFFLMVEGARIDHAAHANDIAALLHDQLAFDDAAAAVLQAAAGRDDLLVVLTSDHGNANPGLNGMGSSYRRSNEHFARIARMSCSTERLMTEWSARKGGPAQLSALMDERLGFKPDEAEVGALLATLDGKAPVEWNHLLANPPGLLGQIVGNRTGVYWTGTTHTSDPTLITATGPGAEHFHGLVRNDHVYIKLSHLLALG